MCSGNIFFCTIRWNNDFLYGFKIFIKLFPPKWNEVDIQVEFFAMHEPHPAALA